MNIKIEPAIYRFIRKTNYIIAVCISFSLISYCFFLRGVESDGREILSEIIFKNGFFYAEKARILFHFFYEFPFVLYLKIFPHSSLYLTKIVWSVSLIWMHIFSLISSYIILPKNKKYFIFFPLIGFVFGPMTSLGLSISVSFIVSSYIWMLAFIIHYSNLSLRWHKFIFILSICSSFLSHEIMTYMVWPLIFLCIFKLKRNKETQLTIQTGIILLSINFLISGFFTLFPDWPEHRSYFMESLERIYFFYKEGFYAPSVSTFLVLVIFFTSLLKTETHQITKQLSIIILSVAAIFFCIMNFINPIYPVLGDFITFWNEYDKRVWVVIALPFSLLIWWLFEINKVSFLEYKVFFFFCIILTISITGWRIGTDYRFYQYQTQFAKKLSHCQGYVSWSEVEKSTPSFRPWFLNKFHTVEFEQHIIDSSIIFPNSFKVKSIIKSNRKPTWFCLDFSTRKKCLSNMNKFDFSLFIQFVKSQQSSCG